MPFLTINNLTYHYEITGAGPPLLLLHGFTGSAENWSEHVPIFAARFTVVTVDLPGHGLTDAPDDPARYAMAQAAADLIVLLDTMTDQPANLLGYSMGGRLALYTVTVYRQHFQSLILESASPGLRTDAERAERSQHDEALAHRIEQDGIKTFVDYWERISLFESQRHLPMIQQFQLREDRLRNRPTGLANSLRGMGTGVQPSLWDKLSTLNVPALLLVGELDTKFVGIADQMYDLLPDAQMFIVPDAGHTVHLEQPAVFQTTVLNFLRGE
jgi:2-succinyl-6-hydroxy-2,4-cyclohexadiene-1-carboxylate synthase